MKIIGTGSYLPDTIVTNDDFTKIVDTSDEWITTRTGIKQRHLSSGESAADMALFAARPALEDAGIDAEEIDVILVSTATPDYMTPGNACILQGDLGAANAFCLDFTAACSSFVYGMDLAARYLQDPRIHKVLLVAVELLSRFVDFSDRASCILFGDAAAAVVLSDEGDGGILASRLGADGTQADKIVAAIQYPERHPWTPADHAERFKPRMEWNEPFLKMKGREVFRFAVTVMERAVRDVLEESGYTTDDLDMLIPHQANTRIIDHSVRKLGLKPEQVFNSLAETGNTSSASIGIGLDVCRREGRIRDGDLVALCGFGGGLTYGAVLLRI